jgi:hypothetical protein
MGYRYGNCIGCGCPISDCGGCSWPTQWKCAISGVSTSKPCPVTEVTPAGGPPQSGNGWPWTGDCDAGADCESVMNGTFTLSGGTAPGGWNGGPANWSAGVLATMCNTDTFGGHLDLYCMGAAAIEDFGPPSGGTPGSSYSLPGLGLLLMIRAWGGPLAYWWWSNLNTIPASGPGSWYCGGPSYGVPYFCPFSEIQCLQPVKLNQLAYTPLTFPIATSGPGTVPPGAQSQSPICSGFPSSVTIVPA